MNLTNQHDCLCIIVYVLLQRPVRANRSASPRYTEMSEKEIRQMIVKEQQVRGKNLFFELHFDAEKHWSICPDRIGTNMGGNAETRWLFLCRSNETPEVAPAAAARPPPRPGASSGRSWCVTRQGWRRREEAAAGAPRARCSPGVSAWAARGRATPLRVLWHARSNWTPVRTTPFFTMPFQPKHDPFTKTGSGQTLGKKTQQKGTVFTC
jgi:hypothetical protein